MLAAPTDLVRETQNAAQMALPLQGYAPSMTLLSRFAKLETPAVQDWTNALNAVSQLATSLSDYPEDPEAEALARGLVRFLALGRSLETWLTPVGVTPRCAGLRLNIVKALGRRARRKNTPPRCSDRAHIAFIRGPTI